MPSKIEYCDETLEVTGGCTKCSPGCKNCWAIKEVWRMAHNPLFGDKWKGLVEKKDGVLNWTGKIKCFDDVLEKLRKKPTIYFVDSKSDLFHKDVPFEYIDSVFAVGSLYPQHTLLVFTKRVDRMLKYFTEDVGMGFHRDTFIEGQAHKILCEKMGVSDYEYHAVHFPLPNVQFFLSISTQKEANEKIPIHLRIPGFHGLSIEPMLERIDLFEYPAIDNYQATAFSTYGAPDWYKPLSRGIDGVIVGGESGPGARPMHPDWPRNIRDQCVAAGVPFYFKQWGAYTPDGPAQVTKNDVVFLKDGTLMDTKDVFRNGWQKYYDTPTDCVWMKRVSKKKAGCMLDGKIWKLLPAPPEKVKDDKVNY